MKSRSTLRPIALLWLLLAGCSSHAPRQTIGITDLPPVMLWAWEMPEDMRFIDTTTTGVAYLAEELLIHGEQLEVRSRQQPLKLSPGTRAIPVIRIETNGDPVVLANGKVDSGATLDSELCRESASRIMALVRSLGTPWLQLDYDARLSERVWYEQLLHRLRTELGENVKLSITALASWCIEGKWLDTLPIDEAVPMLFQMGIAEREVHDFMQSGRSFRAQKVNGLAGISVDEVPRAIPKHQRIYIFNPRPWTAATYHELMNKYGTAH